MKLAVLPVILFAGPACGQWSSFDLNQPAGTPRPATLREPTVNVQDYGAKGDGATDDTAALQIALNAVPAGSTVFFPAGQYKTTNIIRVHKRLTIAGARGSVLKPQGAHPNNRGLYVESTTDTPIVKPGQTVARGATVLPLDSTAGLSIGDKVKLTIGTDPYDAGMPFYYDLVTIVDLTIDASITIDKPISEAVRGDIRVAKITADSSGTVVRGLSIEGVGPTFAVDLYILDCDKVVVRDCQLSNATVGLGVASANGIVVEGCTFQGLASLTNNCFGVQAWGCRLLEITDNRFIDLDGGGVFLESQNRDVAVANNYFRWIGLRAPTILGGIKGTGGSQNIRITGNFFDGLYLPVYFNQEATGSLDNNIFTDCTKGIPHSPSVHVGQNTYNEMRLTAWKSYQYRFTLTPNMSSAVSAAIPIIGYLAQVKISVHSAGSITASYYRNYAIGANVKMSDAVKGGTNATYAIGNLNTVDYPGCRINPGDQLKFLVSTDTKVAAGDYCQFEIKYLASSEDRN